MQGAIGIQIMGEAGLVPIPNRHATNSGKNPTPVDVSDAIEVNPARGQPSLVQHRQQIPIAAGLLGRHHRHLKGAVTASLEQGICYTQGGELGVKQNKATARWNSDLLGQLWIKPAPQHLDCGCITRARIPWPGPKRPDPHLVFLEIGGFKAVTHSSVLKSDMDRAPTWIDQNQCKGEFRPAG